MRTPRIVTAVETIENAEALDDTIAATNAVVEKVLPPGPVRDLLHGEPLGHPAHPIAILVPAGAWISSAVLDFIPGQERASRALVGVGLLGVIPAASAGIADWSVLTQKQQRVGIVHWAANLTSVGLYTASYIQRRRGKQVSGKVLGLLGLAVVSASGYLGGHLAYRQGANVLRTDEPDFASATADAVGGEWKPLAQLVSFQEHKLTASELDGVKLVVYRDGVDVAVIAGTCSFCDDDLSTGTVVAHGEGDRIECPQDGSVFELATGAVVRGPATAPLPRFEAMITEGMVNVRR